MGWISLLSVSSGEMPEARSRLEDLSSYSKLHSLLVSLMSLPTGHPSTSFINAKTTRRRVQGDGQSRANQSAKSRRWKKAQSIRMQVHLHSTLILLKDSIYQEAIYHDISRGVRHSGNVSIDLFFANAWRSISRWRLPA